MLCIVAGTTTLDRECIFVTRVTRRVPHVEQDLLTLPGHMSSPPFISGGSCCSIISFLYIVLQIVVCRLALFLLAIMFSVLRITVSDYTFGIFKLFIACIIQYVFPNKSYFHSVYFSQLATKVQQMQFSLTVKVSERVLFNIKSAIFTLFFLKDEVG